MLDAGGPLQRQGGADRVQRQLLQGNIGRGVPATAQAKKGTLTSRFCEGSGLEFFFAGTAAIISYPAGCFGVVVYFPSPHSAWVHLVGHFFEVLLFRVC